MKNQEEDSNADRPVNEDRADHSKKTFKRKAKKKSESWLKWSKIVYDYSRSIQDIYKKNVIQYSCVIGVGRARDCF